MAKNQSTTVDLKTDFKQYLRDLSISESDVRNMPITEAIAWSRALIELGLSIQQEAFTYVIDQTK
jgi:hypothetical protein